MFVVFVSMFLLRFSFTSSYYTYLILIFFSFVSVMMMAVFVTRFEMGAEIN